MTWWMDNKLRMIQNNLRDIDVKMDIDQYVATLVEFGANACMVGCGGITSFYPTDLEYQYRNPFMEGDFFGELLEKCHKKGIRVIARFDFSKTHESIYEKHKAWYTISIQGEPVRYHDTVATCVNGVYQQQCTLEILKEVISRYPVDGVFFNMFGYQTRDYSDNYIGICQCESCKSRFIDYCGFELPKIEGIDDPIYQKYMEFKQFTVDELLHKIYSTVKTLNPEVAVCTYNHLGVDMVRNESNSAVDRPYPFWIYSSENNVSVVNGSFTDRVSSNCIINAVDIFYRFMGVSKHLNQIRLYGNIASGAGLDWCIIGSFEDYPDRDNYETVKEVFRFHKKYEDYFGSFTSQAKILLVNPHPFGAHSPFLKEYLGIFKMLKEEHRLFDVAEAARLDYIAEYIDKYDIIIIPGIKDIKSEKFIQAIGKTRACVVATGLTMLYNPKELKELFGVELKKKLESVRGAYLLTEPKEVFQHFINRDWVYLDMEYYHMNMEESNEGILPLISPSRYGPPERCYGHQITKQASISIKNRKYFYLPFEVGALYYQHGFEDFKYLLLNAIDYICPSENAFTTNAPKCVEVFFDQCAPDKYLLQLLNLSGFNGTTVFEPVPLHDLEVSFNHVLPSKIYQLTLEEAIDVGVDLTNKVTLPILKQYAAYLIETRECE